MSQNPSFQHKKSLGQHFLNNAAVPKAMADAGDVQKGDIILEIGPGTGMLTRELLKRGARVVALEADIRAITALELEFADEMAAKRLMVVHGDARTTTITSLSNLLKPGDYKVIANIPYYLSGMLFRVFLESKMQPKTLVFWYNVKLPSA